MFRKLLLKTTMMETNFFCLANSCRSLQLWASSFDVSLVWVLNPFGVRISNLPKLQQAATREFSWKIPVEERTNFCVKWRPYNRTIVDTYFDFPESFIFSLKLRFHNFLFEFCMSNSESAGHSEGIFVKKFRGGDHQF